MSSKRESFTVIGPVENIPPATVELFAVNVEPFIVNEPLLCPIAPPNAMPSSLAYVSLFLNLEFSIVSFPLSLFITDPSPSLVNFSNVISTTVAVCPSPISKPEAEPAPDTVLLSPLIVNSVAPCVPNVVSVVSASILLSSPIT